MTATVVIRKLFLYYNNNILNDMYLLLCTCSAALLLSYLDGYLWSNVFLIIIQIECRFHNVF